MKKIICSLLLMLSFNSFSQELNTGPWRFELETANAKVPFIMELKWNKKRLTGTIFNGKETIELSEIVYSGKKIKIPLQTYEAALELNLQSPDYLTGHHVRYNKSPIVLTPIKGRHGTRERYLVKKNKAETGLSGTWKIDLTDEAGKVTPGIGTFEQKDNYFTGSILTPMGDYRYIEGFVSGNEFEGASFDGIFNYVLKGKIESDKKMIAEILSNSKTKITGQRDQNVALPDAYKQTQLDAISFKLPDLKGNLIGPEDKKFKNKPLIIQFFGSWCPNCIDEMNYLIDWYPKNSHRAEIIALAFERSLTDMDAKRQLIKVQKKNKLPYTLLIAASTSKTNPEDVISGLKNFISFPTTVFLNKKHQIIKVHAGFTGPSTGQFFETWKKEFEENVREISK